jgi:ACS family sodium-dependent inorganic phosphate cotransporter
MQDGPFIWDEPSQGLIKSCYFWGYFISQFPGAWVAERFSAKWVMFFSVFINVFGTLLTPPSAELHFALVILMRVLEGIGGGVTFPSMHVMLATWAPPNERSIMSAIVYAGTALGTVASMLLAGLLAGWFGWESVFYVMGGLSCIWCILWIICIQDSPNKQGLISQEERDYINSSLGKGDNSHAVKRSVPWGKVFKSGPFLGILIAHTCSNWGWYMLLIELPFYMKQVLSLDIKQNATATSIPFLTLWFFSIFISKTLDTLRGKGFITTTTARKIATFCASFVPLCCLLVLCYIGCNPTAAILIMGLAITSIGGMFSGFLSNHIDIAPNFAGSLMAVTNTVATIPGIIVPIFVGWITHGNQTIEAWRVIFFVTITLYVIEIIAYLLLGSGEEQSWNKTDDENKGGPEATPLRDK